MLGEVLIMMIKWSSLHYCLIGEKIKKNELIIKNLLPQNPPYKTAFKTLLLQYHQGLYFLCWGYENRATSASYQLLLDYTIYNSKSDTEKLDCHAILSKCLNRKVTLFYWQLRFLEIFYIFKSLLYFLYRVDTEDVINS